MRWPVAASIPRLSREHPSRQVVANVASSGFGDPLVRAYGPMQVAPGHPSVRIAGRCILPVLGERCLAEGPAVSTLGPLALTLRSSKQSEQSLPRDSPPAMHATAALAGSLPTKGCSSRTRRGVKKLMAR